MTQSFVPLSAVFALSSGVRYASGHVYAPLLGPSCVDMLEAWAATAIMHQRCCRCVAQKHEFRLDDGIVCADRTIAHRRDAYAAAAHAKSNVEACRILSLAGYRAIETPMPFKAWRGAFRLLISETFSQSLRSICAYRSKGCGSRRRGAWRSSRRRRSPEYPCAS